MTYFSMKNCTMTFSTTQCLTNGIMGKRLPNRSEMQSHSAIYSSETLGKWNKPIESGFIKEWNLILILQGCFVFLMEWNELMDI